MYGAYAPNYKSKAYVMYGADLLALSKAPELKAGTYKRACLVSGFRTALRRLQFPLCYFSSYFAVVEKELDCLTDNQVSLQVF